MQYILETDIYLREHECLKKLHDLTEKHPWKCIAIPTHEGQFLNMLVKLINAKNTIEIDIFTGYSFLVTALALPHDGKILALDVNWADNDAGLLVIEKSGVAHKIDFREGPTLPILDRLLTTEKNKGGFEFIFVDADKENYLKYHKRAIKLVKLGGVITYDNTLWNGSVVNPPEAPQLDYIKHSCGYVQELNKALTLDSRIVICQLSIADGITMCRRII